MKDFDRVYKYYDSILKVFNFYKVDEIIDALQLNGGETVLDLGGGTGYLAKHMSKLTSRVYVLDESEKMLSKVPRSEKVVPVLGDATKTEFADNSIDVVTIIDALHHIEDQSALLAEAKRVLKDNGLLLILDLDKNHLLIKMLKVVELLIFPKVYFRSYMEVKEMVSSYFELRKEINKGSYFIIVGEKLISR